MFSSPLKSYLGSYEIIFKQEPIKFHPVDTRGLLTTWGLDAGIINSVGGLAVKIEDAAQLFICGTSEDFKMDMSPKEAKYWRLKAAVQELLNASDEDIKRNPELERFLTITANIVLFYKERGLDFNLDISKQKELEALGVSVLSNRRKVT
jgi:hypothetical protein